ncbi:MAG TPA: DNA damage-inducible protein D [Verrucomicrobiae bacterium]|jgi:DNA-damage-inducible protein D|nr:DNA damage-inducible protein D [Verrucomicrobiae bacterium]
MSEQAPVPVTANNSFERIKRVSAEGNESWSARELARVLEYSEFRHFVPVIEKAKEACLKSNHRVEDHFEQILEMVGIGSGAQRGVEDWRLSRYACYLVIQNADPSKPLVALGQNYFAVQTRRQELADEEGPKEDRMRLQLRAEMKKHNKNLAGAARQAGVAMPLDYAIFMDHGYRGLYGGLGVRDVHERKRLKPKEQLLDHMGSTELAANLFRATQTEEKLRRENVRNKHQANRIHEEVGRKVRNTIRELGGTMPENLPVAENIKKVESREKKRLKAERKKAQEPLPPTENNF